MGSTLVAPWQAGESGNPRGLTRYHRIVIRKARIASPQMLARMIECANDTNAPWASRVQAANAVLDRAWGKAPERVELGDNGKKPMLIISIVDPGASESAETLTISTSEPETAEDCGFQLHLAGGK